MKYLTILIPLILACGEPNVRRTDADILLDGDTRSDSGDAEVEPDGGYPEGDADGVGDSEVSPDGDADGDADSLPDGAADGDADSDADGDSDGDVDEDSDADSEPPPCGTGEERCGGICTSIDTITDCGSCDNTCTGGDPYCHEGRCGDMDDPEDCRLESPCIAWTECLPAVLVGSIWTAERCSGICATYGATCSNSCELGELPGPRVARLSYEIGDCGRGYGAADGGTAECSSPMVNDESFEYRCCCNFG